MIPDLCKAMAWPDGYARLRLGLKPYPWQTAIFNAVGREGSRVAVRTCNEAGKTSTLVTSLILWHMEAHTESKTVTTSGSYRQIKDQLFPQLLKASSHLEKGFEFGDCWGRHTGTKSTLSSFSTDNPGKAEGYHAQERRPGEIAGHDNPLRGYVTDAEWREMADAAHRTSLLLIMDEAKTPPQSIHDAFERCHATRWINLSSPGPAFGPFYDCFNKHRARWSTHRVQAMDCPHLWADPLKRAELEDQIQRLRPELVQSMIYGEFMPESAGMVFDMARVEAAMSGAREAVGEGKYRRAALDLSCGGDEQVLGVCDGNRAWVEWAGHIRDDEKLAQKVISHLKRCGISGDDCLADNGGAGQVQLNWFEKLKYPLNRFDFGGQPRKKELYLNARAEAYFTLADLCRMGHVLLPDDDLLREELAFARYEVDSDPLKLVQKKSLPHSPNRSDVMAMLFWQMPEFELLAAAPPDTSDRISPTRHSKDREEFAGGNFDE